MSQCVGPRAGRNKEYRINKLSSQFHYSKPSFSRLSGSSVYHESQISPQYGVITMKSASTLLRNHSNCLKVSKLINRHNSTAGPSPPKLFEYKTIVSNLKPSVEIISAVEQAFGRLAKGLVDVPIPMHIGIHETPTAGPGDCKLL